MWGGLSSEVCVVTRVCEGGSAARFCRGRVFGVCLLLFANSLEEVRAGGLGKKSSFLGDVLGFSCLEPMVFATVLF